MDLNNSIIQVTRLSYDEFGAILPCIILGIFCGIGSYFQNYLNNEDFKINKYKLMANVFTSAILSFIIFAILDDTELTFMTKLSISSSVAFLGIDKALDLVERLLKLRNGKTKE